MTHDDERRIVGAIGAALSSYEVPPVPHARIAAAAAARLRPAVPRSRWVLSAVAAAVVGAVAISPLSHGVANAARSFIDRASVLFFPNGSRVVVKPNAITLQQAYASRTVRFVLPRGLPAGTTLLSVTQAPRLHGKLTLTYRTPDDRVFEIQEFRDARTGAQRRSGMTCLSLNGRALTDAIAAGRLSRYVATNDPADLPKGIHVVRCGGLATTSVRGTAVIVRSLEGRLTGAELDSIMRATH